MEPLALITLDDFKSVHWHLVIEQAEEKECSHYASLFARKMQEAETSGNQQEYSVYRFLAQITALHLRSESKTEPYAAIPILADYRKPIIDDISDEQLKIIQGIISEIIDAELRARISDVIWIRLCDYEAAVLAINAYLDSATVLEHPENWTESFYRIERALRLSISLGKGGKDALVKVIAHIEAVLAKFNAEDPLFFSHRLMELLLECDKGLPEHYAVSAEKAANNAEQKGEWHRARAYWQTAAKWHLKAGNKENQNSARIKEAETYVAEAGSANSAMAAASHMQHAIEAYRRIGGQRQRTNELYNKLLVYQQDSTNEMQTFSVETDLSKPIKHAQETISGKSLHDAIMTLCLCSKPSRVSDLRQEVIDLVRNHPLQFIVSSRLVDDEGKVLSSAPDMMSSDSTEKERAIREYMLRQTGMHYFVTVKGLIEPARRQILLEHNISLSDILPFVMNNPLVRPGREYIYAEGLRAGFIGDWVSAGHILVTQFEDSIRYFLRILGQTTSGMNSNGVQDERGLTTTLYLPELEKAFGADLVFDLQALLVEKAGSNLRNKVAHGLMSHNEFYSDVVIYMWWSILRLVCWPALIQFVKKKESDESGKIKTQETVETQPPVEGEEGVP